MLLLRTHRLRRRPPDAFVRMHVGGPVDVGAVPNRIVDVDSAGAPIKPSHTPAPRPEEPTDAHAETEADGAADHKSGTRSEKHDPGIVSGNHDERGIHRHNADVRSAAAHHNLSVTPQIPV